MAQCPETGTQGKKVDSATIKSMMKTSLRDVLDKQYYFCDRPECDIVYFAENSEHLIRTSEIRELVYQKEAHCGDVKICYCFQHTTSEIEQAVYDGNEQIILDNINEGIKAGQCACDWRNPQGNCCLGNVRNLIKALKSPGK